MALSIGRIRIPVLGPLDIKRNKVMSAQTVDPKLLEILVCPLTKGPLRYDQNANELVSDQAGLAFPIRDGIPIMLVDEARKLDVDSPT